LYRLLIGYDGGRGKSSLVFVLGGTNGGGGEERRVRVSGIRREENFF
jgi:hypothetical protein